MSNESSERVRNLFAATARDLTPKFARSTCQVLYAPMSRSEDVSGKCRSVLSVTEQQTAARIVAIDGRGLFEQRRAFRRYCGAIAVGSATPLSRIHFEATTKGRPYLANAPNLWFSFASCPSGMLGAWSSSHGIGVDIEYPDGNLEAIELARVFFSRAEAESILTADRSQRPETFCRFWTLKEAVLKSIGEGLPFGLDAFEFVLNPNPQLVQAPGRYGLARQFNPFLLRETDGCAALVTRRLD
jgi:4'-phosphopantetheinyl transferase